MSCKQKQFTHFPHHLKPIIIALAGKGGVGKTSIAIQIIKALCQQQMPPPLLVIDADPASTLALGLGLPLNIPTVADISIPMKGKPFNVGELLDELASSNILKRYNLPINKRQITFDFMAMGSGEGARCYCGINQALALVLDTILDSYGIVLIDNEAGLEHLSRRRLTHIDHLLIVSTPDMAARQVASTIIATAHTAKITIGALHTIFNKVAQLPDSVANSAYAVPSNQQIIKNWHQGQSLLSVPVPDSIKQLVKKLCVSRFVIKKK